MRQKYLNFLNRHLLLAFNSWKPTMSGCFGASEWNSAEAVHLAFQLTFFKFQEMVGLVRMAFDRYHTILDRISGEWFRLSGFALLTFVFGRSSDVRLAVDAESGAHHNDGGDLLVRYPDPGTATDGQQEALQAPRSSHSIQRRPSLLQPPHALRGNLQLHFDQSSAKLALNPCPCHSTVIWTAS